MADRITAFSPEVVKQSEALTGLTDEQVNAVVSLGSNIVNSAKADFTRTSRDRFDAHVKQLTGLEKNEGEDTPDYMSRAFGVLNEKAGKVTAYETKLADLEKQVREGNTSQAVKNQIAELEQKVKDAEKTATDAKNGNKKDFADLQEKYNKALADNENIHLDMEISKMRQNLAFKATYSKEDIDTIIEAKKQEVLRSTKRETVVNDKGERITVFRDSEGNILTNPAKNYDPFTLGDLVSGKIQSLIDPGRKQEGTGTQPAQGGQKGQPFRLNGEKTREAGDSAIRKHLIANGVSIDSESYQPEFTRLRKESGVSELPLE